jgi:hypothetical protein
MGITTPSNLTDRPEAALGAGFAGGDVFGSSAEVFTLLSGGRMTRCSSGGGGEGITLSSLWDEALDEALEMVVQDGRSNCAELEECGEGLGICGIFACES